MQKYCGIGLMSGTSLDGLDMVCCNFYVGNEETTYHIEAFREIPYGKEWREKLSGAFYLDATQLNQLDKEYGIFLGKKVKQFCQEHHLTPDFVASHGHTVFHRPEEKISLQIGSGSEIANESGFTTVNNFRMADVLKGGQGAPLVPIGDQMLFGEYDFCLNIGGISNVSFNRHGKRIAYDIAPANMVLNHLASKAGYDYDQDGKIAASGQVNQSLCNTLDSLPFFKQPFPKSLGREWVEGYYLPIVESAPLSLSDQLATCTYQIGRQIAHELNDFPTGKILITGGGAYNQTLINTIRQHSHHHIVIPDSVTVSMKEALVFAYLGLRRLRGEVNCLASVTGATSDTCSGDVYQPRPKYLSNNI